MAAAYSALTSVLGTIDKLLRSNLLVGVEEIHKQQLESLYAMFDTLQKSLIGKSDGGEPIISKDLQVRIKDVALDAEDEVESLMKQLIIDLDDDDECCRAKLDKVSQQVIQVTDSVNEELIIKQKINNNCPEAENSASPRLDDSIRENVMEGYNKEREKMIERLTKSSGENKLQVVSVVGMAGIGKTTFTKTILFHKYIKRVFHIHGWITVSNNYDLKKLLLVLLHDVIKMEGKNFDEMNIGQLASHVKQGLQGQRYLIVVDDIWSDQDWDRISHWFPDCGNRSRILLTSRDNKVGEYAATNPKDGLVLMRPLTQDESRCLFYHKAFGKNYNIRGSDIDEFEKVGEKVITNCKGLPLMITAVAGILSSKSKLDEWIKVAQNVSSLVNDDAYKQCFNVVALSYNDLPPLMKACFLHFGVFPKAHVISVKKLIRLWIAEGLVNLKGVEEFEQVAARVLHDLIGKSLVIIDKRTLNGQIKTCRIHDLFHDFCSKKAESENLLYVVGSDSANVSQLPTNFRQCCRWMSVQSKLVDCYSSQHSPIEIRSLYAYCNFYHKRVFHLKLLRVLDLGKYNITRLRKIVGDLACLRYLSVMTYETFVDLIGKSLVIVEKRSLDGQIKTCRIHDLFHDLCMTEAESENLLYVVGSDSTTMISQLYTNFRWISIQSENDDAFSSTIEARSLYNINDAYFTQQVFLSKLVRVLDLEEYYTSRLSKVTGDLVCLRYLSVMTAETCTVDLPITNLWNLQTLILVKNDSYFHKVFTFPKEIWQMSQLRHLYAIGISLSSPGDKVLGNLQSVSGLSPSCCTKEIFEGIKKVKKLAIRGMEKEYPTDLKWIDNLKHLQDLESLSIAIQYLYTIHTTRFFSLTNPDSFPQKLKKLKLRDTCLPWEYMSIISKLPELEVLQLKRDAFLDNKWKATDQFVFQKLRFLLIAGLNLVKWTTTAGSHDHFPSLEHIIITDCHYLQEIPQGFADSKTLELIELHKCDPSLVAFAEKIQEKHEDWGRNKLKVTAFNSMSFEEWLSSL